MVDIKDAAVVLTGRVLMVDYTSDFETKKKDGGAQVTVLTADGIAVVKLDADAVQYEQPTGDKPVFWFVRQRPWKMGDRSGQSTAYVRPFTENDLDLLVSTHRATAGV